MPFRTLACEFPSDNPELHDGASWVCLTLLGPARPVRRATAAEPGPAPAPVPDPVSEISAEQPPEPAPGPDPFERLIEVCARVALDTGSTRAAALLPSLLRGEAVEPAALGPGSAPALIARGWLAERGRALGLSDKNAAVAAAWSRVLRGESTDMGECDGTLDAWLAELVAELSGTPCRRDELRRALRGHGVAAFGLLEQVAA